MMTPLLNHCNRWFIQYCTQEKCQSIILDEKAQIINEIDRSGSNVTLIGLDKVALLDYNHIQIYQR